MRILGGSISVPSKVVLTGPLLMSTVNHFYFQRELQPCICAVSQWSVGSMLLHKHGPAPHMSGHASMLPHSGNVGCAELIFLALAALAASPFPIEGM